jgi:hypothetical protein
VSRPADAGGPCRRDGDGLTVCGPLARVLSETSLGVQIVTAVTFSTRHLTQYVGAKRTRKDPILLFNVCPFCKFEFAMKAEPPPTSATSAAVGAEVDGMTPGRP